MYIERDITYRYVRKGNPLCMEIPHNGKSLILGKPL